MFEVHVTIDIPGLVEAAKALSGALQINAAAKPRKEAKAVGEKPVEVKEAPAPAVEKPEAEPVQAPAPKAAITNTPGETAPTVTLDDLGCIGASLIDNGKMPQLLSLLAEYGVNAITALKTEQYDAFAAALRAL